MKYYGIMNAARELSLNGKAVVFDAAEFFVPTNSWFGIYKSEDPAEIIELDDLVAKQKIEDLTEAQYNRYDAKKKTLQPGWPHFGIAQQKLQKQLSPKEIAEAAAGGPVEPVLPVKVEPLADIVTAKPAAKSKK